MCNCDNYTPSCSAKFYPIWCIVWGALSVLSGIIMLIRGRVGTWYYSVDYTPYGVFALLLGLCYLFGGLMMMLGVRMASKDQNHVESLLIFYFPMIE